MTIHLLKGALPGTQAGKSPGREEGDQDSGTYQSPRSHRAMREQMTWRLAKRKYVTWRPVSGKLVTRWLVCQETVTRRSVKRKLVLRSVQKEF